MLALFFTLIFCEKKTTVFYVTPKFSVLPVPLEMIEYFLDEMIANNDRREELCKSATLNVKYYNEKKYTELSSIIDLQEKIILHLMNSLPNLRLNSEEIDTHCKDTRSHFLDAILIKLMSKKCTTFCYPNLQITITLLKKLCTKYIYIDHIMFEEILFTLDEIFNPNIKDEKAKGCLDNLQKKLKHAWIRKIVTDYIQNNHNQIDTLELRIILFKVDFDFYFDKQKMNKAFDVINDKIEQENLNEGYILLEPAFYLHSNLSLTYNNDKNKKETIVDKLLTYKYNNTIKADSSFIKSQKAKCWRIIMRVDYETETLKKYINYERINNKDAIYDYHKCCINNHLEYIFNYLIDLTTTNIICNPKKTYASFDFLNSQTYETLHVADEQPKDKQAEHKNNESYATLNNKQNNK
ncbi:hypothetical protein BDAP_000020 [Binucleata daphniae]